MARAKTAASPASVAPESAPAEAETPTAEAPADEPKAVEAPAEAPVDEPTKLHPHEWTKRKGTEPFLAATFWREPHTYEPITEAEYDAAIETTAKLPL